MSLILHTIVNDLRQNRVLYYNFIASYSIWNSRLDLLVFLKLWKLIFKKRLDQIEQNLRYDLLCANTTNGEFSREIKNYFLIAPTDLIVAEWNVHVLGVANITLKNYLSTSYHNQIICRGKVSTALNIFIWCIVVIVTAQLWINENVQHIYIF